MRSDAGRQRLHDLARPDPYQVGYEESIRGDWLDRLSVEALRELVRLGEERVEGAKPHELEPALGILSGYREALKRRLEEGL